MADQEKQALPLEDFDVTLSTGRVVKMRKLSMRQQMRADSCATAGMEAQYFRIIAMAQSIDGVALTPASTKAGLEAIMDQFSGDEFDELSNAVVEKSKFLSDLKNSLAARG